MNRLWVNFEAGGAWFSGDKKLIPVCIGGLSPARLPKPYSNIQGIDLQDLESAALGNAESAGTGSPSNSTVAIEPFR